MAAALDIDENPDHLRRTVIVRLILDDEDTIHLEDMFDEFQLGCQLATDIGWKWGLSDKSDVRDAAVDILKQYTDLGSQHSILACDRAAEALTSADALDAKADHTVSKPAFSAPTATYDPRTLTVFADRDKASLTMIGDTSRVHAGLDLPDDPDTHQWEYIIADGWTLSQSTLHYRDGEYWLHLGYKQPVPDELSAAENDTVLGVDLNVTGPFAVTSTGEFIGSADELNHERHEYEKHRGSMQEAGTRSAHVTMKHVGSRFANWSVEWLHHRANTLVTHAVERNVAGIVFEDLTDIRERISDEKEFQQWAFAEFQRIVTYKAHAEGVWVEWVPSAYTSQECSRCGFVSRSNRSGKQFECCHCDRQVHADYDAGVMIGKKFLRLRASQTRSDGGATCQLALKSATVPADAGAVASVAVVCGASTDKPRPQRASPVGRAK